MWASEVHRIGFQRCTPRGYALLITGTYLHIGAICFALAGCFRETVESTGHLRLLLFIALVMFLAGSLCGMIGRSLADRQNFTYDYEPDVASWGEKNQHRFTHQDWETSQHGSGNVH